MNRSLEGLYRSLEPLRLYALRQGSHVDKELEAYGEGFGAAEELFDRILGEAFARAGAYPGNAPAGFTPGGMRNALLALGIEAEITERAPEEALTVRVKGVPGAATDLAALERLALAALPAHLDCVFETGGMSWDMAEERFGAWDARDAAEMSWDAFDSML